MQSAYVVPEVVVAVVALVGNLLVLVVYTRDRKLRRLTNHYVASLAVADLLVGAFGIPCAILSADGLPKQLAACLFTISLLVVLCTISILNLVAVCVDRYWAILYPMQYARMMTSRAAMGIIIACWILGAIIGFLPLLGWHQDPTAAGTGSTDCYFVKVTDYNYLVFLYFATIIFPSILMAFFYIRIYCVVLKQLRQMSSRCGPMTINRREVTAAKKLFIIVLFFVLCWIPLYTINCVQAFCRTCEPPSWLLDVTIILSHANSAINPFLYAYHLRDFREAFRRLFGFPSRTRSCSVASVNAVTPSITGSLNHNGHIPLTDLTGYR